MHTDAHTCVHTNIYTQSDPVHLPAELRFRNASLVSMLLLGKHVTRRGLPWAGEMRQALQVEHKPGGAEANHEVSSGSRALLSPPRPDPAGTGAIKSRGNESTDQGDFSR